MDLAIRVADEAETVLVLELPDLDARTPQKDSLE